MLFKTYQKITTLFKEHHGYMSFADLRDHQVTVLQLAEMEEEGSLERFARGWYWCKDCGYEKPEDYQYIEIAKVNPRAGGSKRRNPHLVPETEIFQRRDSGIREQAPCGKKYRGRVSEIKFHRNR